MKVVRRGLEGIPEGASFDLVVVGAGGAGLSAALFAAIEGASVLIIERTSWVGGTTAWSAGTTWIPLTHHASAVNPHDRIEEVRLYLDHAVGEHAPAALREAFLHHGAAAVAAAERHSALRYRPYPKHPDYLSDLPGSSLAGRALEPLPFDGRLLGDLFPLVRPPIPEFTVLGGMMVDRTDINHLLAMGRSWTSLKHALKILGRHALDRMTHPRGTRLVMGNALIGRLLYSLQQHPQVTLAMNVQVEGLEPVAMAPHEPATAGHRLVLDSGEARRRVVARRGVVFASGGFNRDPEWRERMLPGIPAPWSPSAPGHTGQALRLACGLGGYFRESAKSHAFWAPVSMRQRPDGSTAVFPHFVMDRAKPGMITVNQRGERFFNESTPYHLFGLAMQAAHREVSSIPAYLVCDADALKRYGVGMVRPGGRGLAPFVADGYLTEGATLAELAIALGLDVAVFEGTVARFNEQAESGADIDFQRGVTAYQHNIGDASRGGPNPNLGPLRTGPFYAVKLYPGDIGAATGLATDEQARLLDVHGQTLPGLYAVGNDMQSIMGGVYPGPGITVGPGLVFAYIAVRHALGIAADTAAGAFATQSSG
jgi:succinate dehydrogenase/fumarate reductase flavoprotein subunit